MSVTSTEHHHGLALRWSTIEVDKDIVVAVVDSSMVENDKSPGNEPEAQ